MNVSGQSMNCCSDTWSNVSTSNYCELYVNMILPSEQATIEAAVSPAFELCVGLVGGVIYWCREKWRGELVFEHWHSFLDMHPTGARFLHTAAHTIGDALIRKCDS